MLNDKKTPSRNRRMGWEGWSVCLRPELKAADVASAAPPAHVHYTVFVPYRKTHLTAGSSSCSSPTPPTRQHLGQAVNGPHFPSLDPGIYRRERGGNVGISARPSQVPTRKNLHHVNLHRHQPADALQSIVEKSLRLICPPRQSK